MTGTPQITGPILILDGISNGHMKLAALFVAPLGVTPPPVCTDDGDIAPVKLADYTSARVFRTRFTRPADRPSSYQWNDERFELAGLGGDIRIAYASCNGEEHGDLDREGGERNAMWRRMGRDHVQAPFSLLLHGGDQVYTDEATRGHPLSEDWPDSLPRDPSRADLAGLHEHLRQRFFERYALNYAAADFAYLAARVPSLMQWDDHDICDGWGSLRRSRTYSPVGQTLFAAAREAALLFQHGTVEGDLPPRFADAEGLHLGWSLDTSGLRIVAPDLRSERTRRDVMGDGGWQMMEVEAARQAPGRTFLMSSVPLLGPRLSLLEALMVLTPRMQKYEDDLRDQWQSRAHRDSWVRMLRLTELMAQGPDQQVTALSGEIHLATRGEMPLQDGSTLHQLVASGIAHRAPPKTWAKALGTLACAGEAPLPGQPVRIRRIPGQRGRYAAERNYLVLTRQQDSWSASWEFEDSGTSVPLAL